MFYFMQEIEPLFPLRLALQSNMALPISQEKLPLSFRTVVCNILHVAHLVIARKSKSNYIPSLMKFNDVVSTICIY